MYHFNNALQYLRAFVFMVFYSVYVPMCVCVCRYNLMSMCVSIEGGEGGGGRMLKRHTGRLYQSFT